MRGVSIDSPRRPATSKTVGRRSSPANGRERVSIRASIGRDVGVRPMGTLCQRSGLRLRTRFTRGGVNIGGVHCAHERSQGSGLWAGNIIAVLDSPFSL